MSTNKDAHRRAPYVLLNAAGFFFKKSLQEEGNNVECCEMFTIYRCVFHYFWISLTE